MVLRVPLSFKGFKSTTLKKGIPQSSFKAGGSRDYIGVILFPINGQSNGQENGK